MEADIEQRKKYEIARAPPARIKDATGGIFDATQKELNTIFGLVKRVQIVAVIIERDYTPTDPGGGDKGTKSRLRLTLDDGTGILAATWFGVDDDEASKYDLGDLVLVLARAGEYKNEITFVVDGIRKVTDFSIELHHRSLIVKRLKQLIDEGKPLELPGGGRIVNPMDDASKFFSTSKASSQEDMSKIEEPVKIGEATRESFKYTTRLGVEDGDAIDEEMAADGALEQDDDGPGVDPPGNLPMDDEAIKGSIMETIMQPEFNGGFTIEQLESAIPIHQKDLARVLKIMEHERMVEQVSSKPGTYRAK